MNFETTIKDVSKQVLNHPVLKVYTSVPRSFTLPKPIAGNLQVISELGDLHAKANGAALTGFATGALSSKSVHGGALGAVGSGVTKLGTHLFEHGEDIYNRVKRAYSTGEVSLTLPFDEVINATRDGKVLDTVFGIIDGKIQAYSPKGSIKDTPGGMLLVKKFQQETNNERQT